MSRCASIPPRRMLVLFPLLAGFVFPQPRLRHSRERHLRQSCRFTSRQTAARPTRMCASLTRGRLQPYSPQTKPCWCGKARVRDEKNAILASTQAGPTRRREPVHGAADEPLGRRAQAAGK